VDLTEYNELKARQRAQFLAVKAEMRRLIGLGRPRTQAEEDHLLAMARVCEQIGRDAQAALDRARGLI
jgi:DnaJ-domain-containing protein 1